MAWFVQAVLVMTFCLDVARAVDGCADDTCNWETEEITLETGMMIEATSAADAGVVLFAKADGNVVLYCNGAPSFGTNTNGRTNAGLRLLVNGTLQVQDPNGGDGDVFWSSVDSETDVSGAKTLKVSQGGDGGVVLTTFKAEINSDTGIHDEFELWRKDCLEEKGEENWSTAEPYTGGTETTDACIGLGYNLDTTIKTTSVFPVLTTDTVTVTCDDHYILSGDALMTCVKHREFTGTPVCTKDTCEGAPDLTNIGNNMSPSETLANDWKIDYGDVLTVKCDVGYTLVGTDTVTCSKGTAFTAETNTPICEADKCDGTLSPVIDNLAIPVGDPVDPGTVVTFGCNTGYNAQGTVELTCVKGTEYTPAERPTCEKQTCTGLPSATEQLLTDTAFPIDHGVVVTVTCADTYKLEGSTVMTCEDAMTFTSATETQCVLDACTKPDIANIIVTGIPADIEAVVTASCKPGYNIAGDTELTCVKGTTFTSAAKLPVCDIDKCSGLPSESMESEATFPMDFGTVVTVTCITGQTMTGSDTVTCKEGTTFTSTESNESGTTESNESDNGVENDESGDRNGVDDGKKSKRAAKTEMSCDIDTCTGLPEIANLVPSTAIFPVNYGAKVDVDCGPGFSLEEDYGTSITCVKGTKFLSDPEPVCVASVCTGLPEIANLTSNVTFPVDYGTVVTVTCSDATIILNGSSLVTCDEATTFTFDDPPICSATALLSQSLLLGLCILSAVFH